jgi:nitrite reductase/ring-hydroxylating ferredoxin subunit
MNELFAICTTEEINDDRARGFVLAWPDATGTSGAWPIRVTRKANNFYAVENACPHQGARLDRVAGEFLDDDNISSPAENIMPSLIPKRAIASSAPDKASRLRRSRR